MATRSISGGGGTMLQVEDTGVVGGPPILFIHGFSQSSLAWKKQVRSDLAREFRLVTMDLRGHGASAKPRDGYGEPRLWAEDVHAVITALQLNAPVLVGWSYAGVIISDYIRRFGAAHLAGVQLVGAVSRLGEPLVGGNFLDPDFLALVPGLFSRDAEESVSALRRFIRLCMHEEPDPEDLYGFLGFNAAVPPHVREGLFARNVNNDAVFTSLRAPLSLAYGEADRIVSPRMCTHLEQLVPHAVASTYADTGHMPFWERPERFNRELRTFVTSCSRAVSPSAAVHPG